MSIVIETDMYEVQQEGPLVVTTLSSEYFTYLSKTRQFVAEMSDIHKEVLDFMNPKQGFYLKSKKTEASKYFTFYKIERDPFDGKDIQSWEYLSEDNFRVTIFND